MEEPTLEQGIVRRFLIDSDAGEVPQCSTSGLCGCEKLTGVGERETFGSASVPLGIKRIQQASFFRRRGPGD